MRLEEAEDMEKGYKILSSGHDTVIANMISKQLWLPELGLHKTKSHQAIACQPGAHRTLILATELLATDGSCRETVMATSCVPDGVPAKPQWTVSSLWSHRHPG